MNIDTKELERYLNTQLQVFKGIPIYSEFNDGIIEGLNLVKQFLTVYEEREGNAIANAFVNYKEAV